MTIIDSTRLSQSFVFGPIWGHETQDLDCTLLSWRKGQGIPSHVNEEVDLLIVVLSGEGEICVADQVAPLAPGNIVVVPKGTIRSLTATTDNLCHLNVHRRRARLKPMPGGRPADAGPPVR